jgi:YVTN family beta-propeller protein
MMRTLRPFLGISVVLTLVILVFQVAPFPRALAKRQEDQKSSFTLFESGQVRPLALSLDGKTLYSVNTPDNRLEVFQITGTGLRPLGSIPVGLEPVAVAARTNEEVWVVNHLSDSVSIVRPPHFCEGDPNRPIVPGRVVDTLLVGDEPRDIVFAGKNHDRAFITTAHRGQNIPFDPKLTTPGIGRADVWVFDADHLGATLGGTPLTILTLFTDTPRALAVSPDGLKVYAAGFLTGNQTTTIEATVVAANGGNPPPLVGSGGIPAPPVGLIVKFDGTHWVDELGRQWDPFVKFSLPDKDVFVLDAGANPPQEIGSYRTVGTVLFNMVVNPQSGHLYVSNTDARNNHRFEGAGVFLQQFHQTTVRGHLAESRITVIADGQVTPRHLNKHINFDECCAPAPNDENSRSLAFPTDMAITGDGKRLYVAAFGSSKVGFFDTAELENDTFIPDESRQIKLSGGGPSGVVLDEARGRLYVHTRFDNSISIVDTGTNAEIGHIPLFNPEPESIVRGRRFLYDASFSSSHGDSACASCHIFGDFDGLAWDLGDPDNSILANGGIFTAKPEQFDPSVIEGFLPMKGPMTTQSLRGLANHGAMHWRGDRQDNVTPSAQPDQGAFNENAAFKKFNIAFPNLNGRSEQISDSDMQAFATFILQITYPPNPVRKLDNSLTPDQEAGRDHFFNGKTDALFACNGCHVLDPKGNAQFGVAKPGFFGTDGRFSFEFESQIFKIPHLRNGYQKVGKFGMPGGSGFLPDDLNPADDNPFMGDQVRGFGFLHDGSVDTLFRFHGSLVFAQRPPGTLLPTDPGNPEGFPISPKGARQRRELEQFLLAFDSNLAPIVGQQVTLRSTTGGVVVPRVHLMTARADAGDCELVAKGLGRGYLYLGGGQFRQDRTGAPNLSDAQLFALVNLPDGELTFTCVPPGSGFRIGLSRFGDGVLDGDR